LKISDDVAPAQVKFYNVALVVEYFISVTLALKKLDSPALDSIEQ